MTLIDGKVLNILTGTKSSQLCPIWGAKPNQFLNTTNFFSIDFQINLQYGTSPLHAWIRFLELILKLSYRAEMDVWRVKEADKVVVSLRKDYIQRRLWAELGLVVDKPKQKGSGNSNDGNNARRAFSNIDILDILDFNINISCEYIINPEKALCAETFNLYIKRYSWYAMTSTEHKVLVRGYQIIEYSILPVGVLRQHVSEARNKMYKQDR